MAWIVVGLVIGAMVLSVVGIVRSGVREWERGPEGEVGDTAVFVREIGKWERLVFERDRTVRSVKRFANRARFLAADQPEGLVRGLVGLMAFEEIGVGGFGREEFDVDSWKQRAMAVCVAIGLPEGWSATIREWVDGVTEEDCEIYRLLREGPPTNGAAAARVRLRHGAEVARSRVVGAESEGLRGIVSIGSGGDRFWNIRRVAHRRAGLVAMGVVDSDTWGEGTVGEGYGDRVFRSVEEAVEAVPEGSIFDVGGTAASMVETLRKLPKGCAVVLRSLGDDGSQAGAIGSVCRRRNLVGCVDFPLRWAPFVLYVRSLIEQGWIGELGAMGIMMRFGGGRRWREGAGVRGELRRCGEGVDYVDLVRSFMGDPESVRIGGSAYGNGEHFARAGSRTMVLRYGDGRHGAIFMTQCDGIVRGECQRTISWSGNCGLLLAAIDGLVARLRLHPVVGGERLEGIALGLDGGWVGGAGAGNVLNMMGHLGSNGSTLVSSIDEGIRTMKLVDRLRRSGEGTR